MGAFYFTNNVGKHLKQESASVKTEDKEKLSAQERIRYSQRVVCLYKCGNDRYLLEVHTPSHKEVLFGTAGGRWHLCGQ